MSSERYFRPQLQNTRIAGGGDYAKRCATDLRANAFELRVIERIERFDAELHPKALANRHAFGERHIEIGNAGTAHGVEGRVSDAASSRHCAKSIDVEIAIKAISTALVRVAYQVGALRSGVTAEIGDIAGLCDIDRQSTLESRDARPLPAAQNCGRDASCRVEEGQLPDVVEAEYMRAIKSRQAVVQVLVPGIERHSLRISERLREGVRRFEHQSFRKTADQSRLQTVVAGDRAVLVVADGAVAEIRPPQVR